MNKTFEKIFGIIDAVVLILLCGYGAHNLIDENYLTACLLFGVLGVWSISLTLGEIRKNMEGKNDS